MWQATALITVAVAALLIAVTMSDNGQESVRSELLSLTPVMPSLDSRQPVVLTHPDCDNDPPCTSASQTWTRLPPETFSEIDAFVSTWVSRNGLRWPNPHWFCGPQSYLFGDKRAGCQAGLIGAPGAQPIFLGVTLVDQSAAWFRVSPANGLVDPLPRFGRRVVDTISVQVVASSR